jgi:membrane protein YdbS with pleckstrin-like domain
MNNETTTKRSPIILVWKFAIIEVIGFFLYFAAMLLGNEKYILYTQLSFSSLLSYQTAKLLFLTGAEFAGIVYAFLSWYYEQYTVRPSSITYDHGVFFKKRKVFPANSLLKFRITSSPLGRLFHLGSIHVENGSSSTVLKHISRPELFVQAMQQRMEPDISHLLTENEHDQLEFKSSFRYDHHLGKANRDVEKAAMKTVAAFLNSKGGYLVVGVNDSHAPLGLQSDYQTLQRADSDGFENHFTQTFNSMIGPEFRGLVKMSFHTVDAKDLCVVQVLQSPRPVYFKAENNEQFFVRTGNSSTALKLSELEPYLRSRWPGRVREA